MDGQDLSLLDDEIFDGSSMDSDEGESELPLPECIGIDSAVQDDEQNRLLAAPLVSKPKSRSDRERELELKMLESNSIRRQILENSLIGSESNAPKRVRSHVMNITEKAGMSGIDKEKINRIIHEASKGSLFYKKQAQRQAEIHKSIEKMLNRVKAATPVQVKNAEIVCDKILDELEKHRVFNKVIVHFDLDMFFAAVEIRDNPELKEKPVAVGGESMVSTSNYVARRYGVRAAMPGFIAKKLCPELILIKPNGVKYRQASSEVFSILEQYDPELTNMSLDEAYLDLTDYIRTSLERDELEFDEYYDGTLPEIWWSRAAEVVEEIRQAIFDKTCLTCSGGISCNTLLAKISTDINKPDGQFMVKGYPNDIADFIGKTSIEKISGIGKVSAQFLNALEIRTCGDIFAKRQYLPLVFYEINVRFYLKVALGDGSTSIKSDDQRKSKSVERTFSAIKDTLVLLDKLDNICEELCSKYLKPYRIRGRTVTVKLKRNTFTTTTKSYSMLVPTNDKLVIYSAAKSLLISEVANEPPEISYRLLGVKISNLADDGVATNQLTIDAMLKNRELSKHTKSDISVHRVGELNPSSDEINLHSELITQEPIIVVPDEPTDFESQSSASSSKNSTSQKRAHDDTDIKSFFKKKSRQISEDSEFSTNFTSQVDEDEFLDAPNRLSQQEQLRNQPLDEDFQCPYCFKPYSDFVALERHVDTCCFKTSIDVNKTFFSQRLQTPNDSMKNPSQKKSTWTAFNSQAKKSKARRQLNSSPSISSPNNSDKEKISFYQKFLESNSQSLSQSVKIEPFRCPHCQHGFLNFPLLETHVIMCTKKKVN